MRTKKPDAWPTQLKLPGQEAAPDGPVDMSMMYVMHHAFRRDLRGFAAAAQQTPVADREAWQALQERWSIFAEALHHHHAGEDAGVWPALLDRAEPAERLVLDAMEAEHARIDPLLASCADGFARVARSEDDDARAALAVRLCAAGRLLADHLAHEETEAIVLIQKYFSDAEWQRLEEEHFKRSMGIGQAFRAVPWAAYGLPREVREPVLRSSGLLFRLIWLGTRRAFERQQRSAFGYVAEA